MRPSGSAQIGVSNTVSDATLLANVTVRASKGDVWLYVTDTSGLAEGQWVTLTLNDDDGSLMAEALYANLTIPRHCIAFECYNADRMLRFHSRLYAVKPNFVVLERPLPYPVEIKWRPELHEFAPGVQHSGIEGVRLEFMPASYAGHLDEEGWNGVEFAGAANCWVRNVEVYNADNSVMVSLAAW